MRLDIEGVTQAYGDDRVLQRLSFSVADGQIGCLLGPSGCGKSTVLRCIAGFEPVLEGEIRADDRLLSASGFLVPPEQRRLGMVFQDFALLPHLTVRDNIDFGLHARSADERNTRVREMVEITGLNGLETRYPHELSGGQQQRVALARALAPKPECLLLDEPFSSLDAELRDRLAREVRDILKSLAITTVLVTHDQFEAFAVADEVGVMRDGALVQWDTPYNIYHKPGGRFVAGFVGEGVLLPGRVLDDGAVETELGVLTGNVDTKAAAGAEVDVLLRPDDIVHVDDSDLTAVVTAKAFRGADILYTLRLKNDTEILSLVPSHHDHAIGESIGIRTATRHLVTFERN